MKLKLLSFVLLAVTGLSMNAQTQLWGTSFNGGVNSQGTIFSANGDGTNFHTVYNFVNASGAMPVGRMALANNGSLYGCTDLGGFGDSCVSFRFDPITCTYTNIHDLYANTLLGWQAWGGMIAATDGNLYGTCANGGALGNGALFKIDPTNDQYYDIYNFDGTNGGNSYCALKQFSDGKLYGSTYYGGANNMGVIFSFDPASSTYTKLYVFDGASGANPKFGDVIEGTDGKIYGMTQLGGANNVGVVYSFDLGTGTYTVLHSFDGTYGSGPLSGLVQASNGMLYGMTPTGGSFGYGVLFGVNPTTGAFSDLLDFNGTNGASPTRSLTQSGNLLFGTTDNGGTSNQGVAFSFDFTTNTYTKLADFSSSTTGANPQGEIIVTPQFATVGIAALNANTGISVSPNPATNSIIVANSANEELITFTDILGRELTSVKTSALSKTTVDISSFPSVFFAKSKGGFVQKIVRE
jgi:uncharacterized repeat protein (TIGR03803 family)